MRGSSNVTCFGNTGFKLALKSAFDRVDEVRPRATRKESSEMYIYADGFRYFALQPKPDVSGLL